MQGLAERRRSVKVSPQWCGRSSRSCLPEPVPFLGQTGFPRYGITVRMKTSCVFLRIQVVPRTQLRPESLLAGIQGVFCYTAKMNRNGELP